MTNEEVMATPGVAEKLSTLVDAVRDVLGCDPESEDLPEFRACLNDAHMFLDLAILSALHGERE